MITAAPVASTTRSTTRAMTGVDRFLAACRRQPVDATPIWFMRQAGRYLGEYRKLCEQYSILTLAKTPELSTEVSMMPVRELGVDGAVLFADIMLPLEGMGVAFEIQPDLGPVIDHPIRGEADVERLRPLVPEQSVWFVLETIRRLRAELGDRAAVIGFGGAPYTLACYLIEGRPSRDNSTARTLMLREPSVWAALMNRLTAATIRYLRAQVAAGAQVIQLFDSRAGALAPADFKRFVLPWTARVFAGLKDLDTPTIYFGAGNAALLESMAGAGSDVLSIDWRVSLGDAWARIGYDRSIQGNLDPVRALAGAAPALSATRAILSEAAGRPGHIFNLGHGVLPATQPAVLARLVDFVHGETQR